ncbi:hypothetical protein DRO54_07235 [Candidatus Bathyarchaeota archaeon]|nr:MAG: hypothetical protein DRO54_07235 [Candidatus Bathyarchaeota archaeon]
MTGGQLINLEDLDFIFENEKVKVIANRNYPEIKLTGLSIGPFKESAEYEVAYWIAKELERMGIVKFREEEKLDLIKLHKIHWKEKAQTSRTMAQLPGNFYPKLRRFLEELKTKAIKDPEKMRDYEKAVSIAKDIVNCRLRKIVLLASTAAKTNQLLEKLTEEERILYHQISEIINDWRAKILNLKGE